MQEQTTHYGTPWHRESYARFIGEQLPKLLATHIPLAAYHVANNNETTCTVSITVSGSTGEATAEFIDLPYPDEAGIFYLQQQPYVVVPLADSVRLDQATISCVGEQLLQYISERLGQAPAELPWDEALLRTWLPLDRWITQFLTDKGQTLDSTNWISAPTHLRRLMIMDDVSPDTVVTAGHQGRVCPVETPEGPRCGQVVTIAVGAAISDRQLVVKDCSPAQSLGMAARMIPFIEHDDQARALFGANMMRQACVLPNAEPALVQTGCEPVAADFWTGRNLLTAFVTWGEATFGDGIVVSESAARRLSSEHGLEPGDKLANRHGSKGVISAILPNREMPHLKDGTPMELVYSFIGLHTRLNNGQQLEALASRIAHCTCQPVVAPPFQAPSLDAIREQLVRLHLPDDGMEQLFDPCSGKPLARRSLVGWVYWTVNSHLAKPAMQVFTSGSQGQMMGRMEYTVLRDAGAYGFIAEQLNTRSTMHRDADSLTERLAKGQLESPVPPTPAFTELQKRLVAAGIRVELGNNGVAFGLATPPGEKMTFTQPIPHPWLPELQMKEIGIVADIPGYEALESANKRLYRALASDSPESLVRQAAEQLSACVRNVCDNLVYADDVHPRGRGLYSGRAVIAPTIGMPAVQAGVPEEMAWQLFGPATLLELGGNSSAATEALAARNQAAQDALDKVMERSWVVLNRAPTTASTAIVAFQPVRTSGHVLRIHPMVCEWLNADFDGDQVAIYLPVTKAGQHDAEHKLSMTAHLQRDASLLEKLLPRDEAMWGLAWVSLDASGRAELNSLFGKELHLPTGYLSRSMLYEQCRQVLAQEGVGAVLDLVESLWRIGFAGAKAAGASLRPFPAANWQQTSAASPDNEAQLACLAARADFWAEDLGPQLLAVKCGARGNINQLAALSFGGRTATSADGRQISIQHGYQTGLQYEEWMALAADTWRRFVQFMESWDRMTESAHAQAEASDHYGVFARARRAAHPGVVFARAAVNGEVDPLADVDSRLFVGMPMA